MKRKIVGILVMMLLIATAVLPMSGQKGNTEVKQITTTTPGNTLYEYYTHEGMTNLFNELMINPLVIEWDLTLGGQEFDSCYSVKQTEDGGFVFAGGSYSFGPGLSDIWIVKTDVNGYIAWNNTYGGQRNESCYTIQKTLDGGFIVAGKTKVVEPDNFDAILLKIDSDGNELWNKTYGGEEFDAGWWVEPTVDGGYILVGVTESKGNGNGDIWIIKTDSNGDLVWDKTFGGNKFEEAEEVIFLNDGTFIILGSTESFGSGGKDLWMIKINSNGSLLWEKIYGGKFDDEGWSIESTDDNYFFILGRTYSFGAGNQDFWLIKTDNKGDIILNRTFGGDNLDQARRIQKANDGSYLLFGCTQSFGAKIADYWLIVIDENGRELWEAIIGNEDFDIGYEAQQSEDSGYILTGVTYNLENQGDAWLVKLAPYVNQQPSKPAKPSGPSSGHRNKEYTFTTSTTDPDGDDISYMWDWGDGNFSEWLDIDKASYTWSEIGDYDIKVMAKDINGGESEWSDIHTMSITKNRAINTPFLNFLQQYPILYQLLQRFLRL